jgi:hypothetical protein
MSHTHTHTDQLPDLLAFDHRSSNDGRVEFGDALRILAMARTARSALRSDAPVVRSDQTGVGGTTSVVELSGDRCHGRAFDRRLARLVRLHEVPRQCPSSQRLDSWCYIGRRPVKTPCIKVLPWQIEITEL